MATSSTLSISSHCHRILVVDDEDCFSRYVKSLFRNEAVEVTGCCTGRAARDILQREAFDLAVLDYDLPDGSGLELLQWLRASGIETPCVMVTAHGSIELAVEAMKSGANDFITKISHDPEALARILERNLPDATQGNSKLSQETEYTKTTSAASGGDALSGEETSFVDVRELCASLNPPVVLSRREYEVFAAVLQGLSNKEIASTLFISIRTVKNHLTQVYRKFDVESRPQLFNRVLVSR